MEFPGFIHEVDEIWPGSLSKLMQIVLVLAHQFVDYLVSVIEPILLSFFYDLVIGFFSAKFLVLCKLLFQFELFLIEYDLPLLNDVVIHLRVSLHIVHAIEGHFAAAACLATALQSCFQIEVNLVNGFGVFNCRNHRVLTSQTFRKFPHLLVRFVITEA